MPLAGDGLVTVGARGLAVTPRGRLLVRTIAMQFDRHLREAQQRKDAVRAYEKISPQNLSLIHISEPTRPY